MTEIEVKIELDEKNYNDFIAHYQDKIIDTLDQWNIIFDTPGYAISGAGRTCRLRRIIHNDGTIEWIVTSKSGGVISEGVSTIQEIEGPVSNEDAFYILKKPKLAFSHLPECIKERLKDVSGEKLEAKGDFRSIRRVIPWNDLHIEADECWLPNKAKYYELEIETPNAKEVKEQFSTELQSLNIQFQDSRHSKIRRLSSVQGSHISSYFYDFKMTNPNSCQIL